MPTAARSRAICAKSSTWAPCNGGETRPASHITQSHRFDAIIVFLFYIGVRDNCAIPMSTQHRTAAPAAHGLYDPHHEHDACGVGFVVDIKGRRSHAVVEQGLQVLVNLLHRGACGCEANTGDGAGVLIQVPDRFLRQIMSPLGITLPPAGEYGTGLVFLPQAENERERLRQLIGQIAGEEDLEVLGWRVLSIDDRSIGESARAARPVIEQVFVAARQQERTGRPAADGWLERKLYVV